MKAIGVAMLLILASANVASAQRRPMSSQVATVAQLYRDFAWEAVIEEPSFESLGLLDQPRSILHRYFDDRLTELWLADRECQVKTREVCRVDFSPMWSAQDPVASGLKIVQTADSSRVRVTFRSYRNQTVELTYSMARTERGWRITDIRRGAEWSLRQLLERKL